MVTYTFSFLGKAVLVHIHGQGLGKAVLVHTHDQGLGKAVLVHICGQRLLYANEFTYLQNTTIKNVSLHI